MALPVRKGYTGNGIQTTLSSSVNNSTTTIPVTATTNWPGSFPFFVVVDPGTSSEEKMKVTANAGGSLTVVRGQDNTSAASHADKAVIYIVFTASEADEANQIASVMTTKGDLIATNGSDINRLAVGATNTHVLQVDSTATNGFKWGQVATAGIADDAITSAKIADGSIVNADINASAAIVDTKLATISTASKVSNSATTATSANTASAIVARDASGNFSAGTITATLTGNVTGNVTGSVTGTASGNLVAGGALGTPSSGTLTNCTFPTLNQSTTGNAATATSLVGLKKGSNVVYMSAGSCSFEHLVGSTPSTAVISNGDTSLIAAAFEIVSMDADDINIRAIGSSFTGNVRINWIAFA